MLLESKALLSSKGHNFSFFNNGASNLAIGIFDALFSSVVFFKL